MPAITKIQNRRGTSSQWSSTNPVLAAGEIGVDTTLGKVKVGDGVANWAALPFLLAADLAAKADKNNPQFTGAVSFSQATSVNFGTGGVSVAGLTKDMVGLGNVDNTADVDKPLTSAASTKIDLAVDGKLGLVNDLSTAENIPTPDRMTGPVGQRLTMPTHIASNTTGEATHPSVVFRPEGWNGYTYWMAFTPYQNANDSMEDPNVVASMDGINWVVPAGLTNPLADAPGSPSNYNSDTDAEFGPDNKLYVFYRNYDPADANYQERLYYRCSADGVNWEAPVLVAQAKDTVQRYISPAFIFENGKWTCWYIDMLSSPFRIVRMTTSGSSPAYTNWSAPVPVTYLNGNGTQAAAYMAGHTPWHISVVKGWGRYHMLVADFDDPGATIRNLIYMNSGDGKAWLSAIGPCVPRVQAGQHDSMYRSCMIPAVQRGVMGFRVWYGAFQSGSPQVWSIYRTFITDGPRSERGSFTANIAAATSSSAPSYQAVQITFSRDFKYTPDVVVSCSTGFIAPAAWPISTTGFQFNIDNPVMAARNGVTFTWTATEPY